MNTTEPVATFEASLSNDRVGLFFKAVDWKQPLYPVMPPTLATAFRNGEFEALKKLNIPLHKVLHGEQKYKFNKDLLPGLTYRGETFLTSQYEKSGGSGTMTFYVLQTNLIDGGGETCVECCTTIIARS